LIAKPRPLPARARPTSPRSKDLGPFTYTHDAQGPRTANHAPWSSYKTNGPDPTRQPSPDPTVPTRPRPDHNGPRPRSEGPRPAIPCPRTSNLGPRNTHLGPVPDPDPLEISIEHRSKGSLPRAARSSVENRYCIRFGVCCIRRTNRVLYAVLFFVFHTLKPLFLTPAYVAYT
jgi:hypothetical protein